MCSFVGKELTMVSVEILILFLKSEIYQTLTLSFFAKILNSLPGAAFFGVQYIIDNTI